MSCFCTACELNSLYIFNLKNGENLKRIIVHDLTPDESQLLCALDASCPVRLPGLPRGPVVGGLCGLSLKSQGQLFPGRVCVHLAANGTVSGAQRGLAQNGGRELTPREQLEGRSWDRSCGGTRHRREGSTTESQWRRRSCGVRVQEDSLKRRGST